MDQSGFDLASIHSAASGEDESWGSAAADWISKGVPAALTSGLVSMANTGIALGNVLGADADKLDTGAILASFDDDVAQYYQQHQQGVDLGGFIATSLVPGMIGIKALKMLQGGTAGVNAARVAGSLKTTAPAMATEAPSFLANPLAYAAKQEAFFTAKSLEKIRLSANEIYSAVDKDKLAAIAFGAADQALQGAAFETAVLLTMNQSPVLSKEDEGYFTSIGNNIWDIPKAALLQGGIGGAFGGAALIGKFAKFKRAVDTEQWASVWSQRVGANFIATSPGTLIAADFSYLDNLTKGFAARKAAGEVTDAEITNYERQIKRFTGELKASITTELIGAENAAINEPLWNLIINSENPAETANILLGAAKAIRPVDTSMQNLGKGPVVIFGGDALPARKAENMLNWAAKTPGSIFPEVLDAPEQALLDGIKAQGFALWKDAAGTFHAIEGSRYAKTALTRDLKPRQFEAIVKLIGKDAGTVTTTAFPVVGDSGKEVAVRVLRNGEEELRIGDATYGLPAKYNHLTDEPLDANAQFVFAQLRDLKKLASPETGDLFIAKGDLPLLEAATKKGFESDVFYGGENVTTSLQDTLHQAKIEARQELINAGEGFDKISRQLNVERDWAETGRGDGFILKEDHTKPIHAAISYNTGWIPNAASAANIDGHSIRGINNLMNLVQLGKNQNEAIAATILGKDYSQLPSTKGTLFDVTTLPESSTLIKSTSGEYGTTLSYFQQSGKVVNKVIRERAQAVFQSLQAAEAQLLMDPKNVIEANIVLNRFRSGKEGYYKWEDGDQIYFVPKSIYKKLNKAEDEEAISELLSEKDVWQIKNKAVEEYFLLNIARESSRASEWNLIFGARGSGQYYDPNRVHVPPIDTTKYSHINFIKEKMEIPGRAQESGVVVANTAEELAAKVDRLRAEYGDRFEIYTKTDIKLYKIAKGEFETGPMLGDSLTDQAMRNEGLLYEFQPRVDKEFINDFNNWHWRQENNIVRNTVELKYAQEFAELRALARRFDESKFGPGGKDVNKNPYYNYIKTALDVSNFDRYNGIWGKFNDVVEKTGSGMVDVWRNAFHQAEAGKEDWVTANRLAESYGFTPPFKNAIASVVQPMLPASRALEPAIAKLNSGVSFFTLGLDFLNSVVSVMSFPIMATAEMTSLLRDIGKASGDGGAAAKSILKDLTTVAIPGHPELLLPTPMKLLINSIKRLFNDSFGDGSLLKYYKEIEAVKDPYALGMQTLASSTLTPEAIASAEKFSLFSNKFTDAVSEYGRTVSGSNKAETWVRFLAADMMKQITDSLGVESGKAAAYINSYVNRVHGNYLANQRPHLFQGVVGQAISLFQTYQFNLTQNLVRYVGNGDKTAAAMLLGLQNTIFGLQGNPAFYILNEAIGKSNPEHIDILSGSRLLVGAEVSDWVMYGLGSNALHTSLYNRGDLTPRYLTVVPTQIKDIPSYAVITKAISSFLDAASQISKGAGVTDALLNGISHFGLNRPLAGVAQLAQGFRTSSKGDLISAYNDVNGWTVAAKLAGGEELNRQIAMDAYYRNLQYKAYDFEQKQSLGRAVKDTMYSGRYPTEDQVTKFMQEYNRTGGSPQSFNRWMHTEFKHATQSQMNVLKAHVNSPAGRNQATMMGADTGDFWYNPPTERATTGEE